MARQRGLTLIEMLIALVIMSAVMTLSAQAYRFYIEQSGSGTEKLKQNFTQMRQILAVQDQLAGAFHYFMPGAESREILAFEGTANDVMWVSTTSVQNNKIAALAWLGVDDGTLTYCEMLLTEHIFKQLPEKSKVCDAFSSKIQRIDDITFTYYGWPGIAERLEEGKGLILPAKQSWSGNFSGLTKGVLPNIVRLEYSSDTSKFEIMVTLPNLDVSRVNNALSN